MELTVGYVAGMVAAGFFISGLLAPNALALIMSWRLRETNTAATLTVAANSFQKSLWPLLLYTDGNHSDGVSRVVLWSARLIPTLGLLLAVGSVITPLGLYSALLPGQEVRGDFMHVADSSTFGYGTPPRSNFTWARKCSGDFLLAGPRPCPFEDSISIVTHFPNGTINWDYPYNLSTRLPQRIVETYSSGTNDTTTISNYFDIQWRRYTTQKDRLYDNGSHFLAADNRYMESLILGDTLRPVEGLIVDTVKGGVGFRNHTLPGGFAHGAVWEEDLLFVEPETVCVDTNLTMDYTIVNDASIASGISDFRLTDRGGFVNLIQKWPLLDLDDTQANPDLYTRAYKAAWIHNAYTALYFNVTTIADPEKGVKAWSYLNSEMEKTFRLSTEHIFFAEGVSYLTLSSTFGDYIQGIWEPNGAELNPFGITSANYSDIPLLCGGVGGADFVNISTILVACGQMRSVPQRVSPGSSLVMDDGSSWSQKIYACATAPKATIKTVTLSYNTSAADRTDLLTSLTVEAIHDKAYESEDDMPFWGVEDTGNGYIAASTNLVWGLVSPSYASDMNVSVIQQPSLYLPGWFDDSGSKGAYTYGNLRNMPGSDFSIAALLSTYSVEDASTGRVSDTATGGIDYTGQASLAMWAKWQNLTKSADSASLIPNLIFTDSAASIVVGTKGALGPGNANGKAVGDVPVVMVKPIYSQIRYNILYAIPALIAAILLLVIVSIAIVAALGKGWGFKKMRQQIEQLSSGRIYTTFLYPDTGALTMTPKEWSQKLGDRLVDLSGEHPVPGVLKVPEMIPEEQELKDTATVTTAPVSHGHESDVSRYQQHDTTSGGILQDVPQEQYYYESQSPYAHGYHIPGTNQSSSMLQEQYNSGNQPAYNNSHQVSGVYQSEYNGYRVS